MCWLERKRQGIAEGERFGLASALRRLDLGEKGTVPDGDRLVYGNEVGPMGVNGTNINDRLFRGKCGQLLYVAVAPPISSLSKLHISYKARCEGISSRQKELPNKQTRACGIVVDLTLYKILESALFVTGKVIAKCPTR
jgi:hypothetical protein